MCRCWSPQSAELREECGMAANKMAAGAGHGPFEQRYRRARHGVLAWELTRRGRTGRNRSAGSYPFAFLGGGGSGGARRDSRSGQRGGALAHRTDVRPRRTARSGRQIALGLGRCRHKTSAVSTARLAAEAFASVVVDHADSLHKCVADRGAHEAEPALFVDPCSLRPIPKCVSDAAWPWSYLSWARIARCSDQSCQIPSASRGMPARSKRSRKS